MYKHGKKGTKIYNTWRAMLDRTRRKSHICYKYYGGKGIKVCEEWKSFINFYNWAINNGYEEGLTIDRIDNAKDYCPENCKFSTREEQSNNKTCNHLIEFNGEIHNITEWSRLLGIPRLTIFMRLKRGWNVEKALTKKVRK